MLTSEDIKNIIGRKVKQLRTQRGLTQEKLAEYIGLQPQTIAKIETGKRFISADVLSKLCNFFDVVPCVFFTMPETKFNSQDLDYISQINSNIKEIFKILSEK